MKRTFIPFIMHWKAFASINAVLPVDGADKNKTLDKFPLSKGN